MFEGYLKDATGTRRAHLQTIQAAAAWRAERYDEARKLLDELGTDVHEEVFSDWFNTSYATAQGQIHAFSGPQGAAARRAQRLADAGKTEQALASYEAVTKAGVSDPVARSYVESRVRALRFQQQLSAGSWADLRPDAEFAGWRKANGAWVLEEDGTIRGTSDKDGLWLGWDQRIDDARPSALPTQAPKADTGVAFAGEMQLVASGREEAPNCAVEVELGGGRKVDSIIWAVSRPKQEVMLTHTAGGEGTVYAPAQVTDWNTFRVEVWKNRVTTYLNDKLVNREVKMGTARPGAAIRVSVGSYAQYAGMVVRFRNLRVRRLTKKPTVAETLPKE
jgi:hypothetical protein